MKISIEMKGAQAKLDESNIQRGKYALANQAIADMNPFIPMRESILRQTATIDLDGSGINYNTPYAARLFYMFMFNYTTPGTGPRWDLKAKSLFMSDWIKAFERGAGW